MPLDDAPAGPTLIPIDYDPFKPPAPSAAKPPLTPAVVAPPPPAEPAPARTLPNGLSLVPIDYDPFAKPVEPQKAPGLIGTAFEAGKIRAKEAAHDVAQVVDPFATRPPEAPDMSPVGQLLRKEFGEGITDPKWIIGQIAGGITSSWPAMATGLAGAAAGAAAGAPFALVGAIPGAIAGGISGYSIGAAMQAIGPAYQQAIAQKKSHAEAVEQAWKVTGLAGLFGALAAGAPAGLGYAAGATVKRQVAAALADMFIAQPGIGVGEDVARGMVTGDTPTWGELGTTALGEIGGGIALEGGAHAARRAIRAAYPAEQAPPAATPATPAGGTPPPAPAAAPAPPGAPRPAPPPVGTAAVVDGIPMTVDRHTAEGDVILTDTSGAERRMTAADVSRLTVPSPEMPAAAAPASPEPPPEPVRPPPPMTQQEARDASGPTASLDDLDRAMASEQRVAQGAPATVSPQAVTAEAVADLTQLAQPATSATSATSATPERTESGTPPPTSEPAEPVQRVQPPPVAGWGQLGQHGPGTDLVGRPLAPDQAEGTLRLYRGEGGGSMGSVPNGNWFSTDPARAALYGAVRHIDVSANDLGSFARGAHNDEFFAPDGVPEIRQNAAESRPAELPTSQLPAQAVAPTADNADAVNRETAEPPVSASSLTLDPATPEITPKRRIVPASFGPVDRLRLASAHEAEIRAELDAYAAKPDVQKWAAEGGDLAAHIAQTVDRRMQAWHNGFEAAVLGEDAPRDGMNEVAFSRSTGYEDAEALLYPSKTIIIAPDTPQERPISPPVIAPDDEPNAVPPGTRLLDIPVDLIDHGESALPGGKLTWPGSQEVVRDYALLGEPASAAAPDADLSAEFDKALADVFPEEPRAAPPTPSGKADVTATVRDSVRQASRDLGKIRQQTAEATAPQPGDAVPNLDNVARILGSLFEEPSPFAPRQLEPGVDADRYEKAHPAFKEGLEALGAKGGEGTPALLVKLMQALRDQHGFDSARIAAMKPYVIQFIKDVKSGYIRIGEEPGNAGTDELHGTLPPGAGGAGAEDVQGSAPPRPPGPAPQAEEPGGPGDVQGADGPAQGPGTGGGTPGGGDRPGDTDRVPAGEPAAGQPGAATRPPGSGRGRRPQAGRVPDADVTGQNHVIEPGSVAEERSWRVKARDNISAIELAKSLTAEGRPATKEEQGILARYVGWGGISNAFPDPNTGKLRPAFEVLGNRVKALLTPDEYRTANRSTQYAHYTSEPVIRAMWSAVERMGFKEGMVLEPGMGVGHFLGMMPTDLAAATKYQGIEMDHLTAQIAKLLYPQSGVRRADFTLQPMPVDTFDLAIGNPPFAGTTITSDPKYAARKFVLHDYFFAKSLDSVRPGGLLAFVTSAGTMNKMDEGARRFMAERAEFIGGVMLPSTAFRQNAGTEVTASILFFKKRPSPVEFRRDDQPKQRPVRGAMTLPPALGDEWPAWTQTVVRELPDAAGVPTKGNVSRYFAEHPEMVLGEEGFFDKLHKGAYAVHETPGTVLSDRLAEAFARLPENIMDPPMSPEQKAALDFASTEKKEGSFYVGDDGRLMQYSEGAGRPVQRRGAGVEGGKTAAEIETIRQLLPVRDALRDVFRLDLVNDVQAGTEARARLNRVYDNFVKKNGPLNKTDFSYRRPSVVQQENARHEAREEAREMGDPWSEGTFDPTDMIAGKASAAEIARARTEARERAQRLGREFDEGTFDPSDMKDLVVAKMPNIDAFQDDQESYRLRALENYDAASGTAVKRRVFVENTLTREQDPEINSAQDGILWSMNKHGRLDLDAIAEKLGVERGQMIEDMGDAVMRVPGTEEVYLPRDAYLSGDVVTKLAEAKTAAERDPSFQKNVSALDAVQPEPLSPADIAMNIGMPWIPVDTMHEFIESIGLGRTTISYSPLMGQWIVGKRGAYGARAAEWGTEDFTPHELVGLAMNRKTPIIRRHDRGPPATSWVDQEATQQAQDKVNAIREAFEEWAQADPERAHNLAQIYNAKYNRVVLRQWNGDYLTTPGVSTNWHWRPHQTRVVARIIQDGNTYMAHAVGAGKTSAMIGAGMEMRRLGLVNKPMYVVPNHMLGQFAKEFYEQYPTARIAVADDRNFHTSRRKQFVANVAQQDLDAIIITNSAFKKVPVGADFQEKMIREATDEIDAVLFELGQNPRELKKITQGVDRDKIYTVKQLQKRKEKLEQKLRGAGGDQDVVNTFEEMGVDFLFVDEAHQFRKLAFVTQTPMKGISAEGSDMAWDLYTKIRYLDENRRGRSLVMASGTPVTNTMGELYSLSRYMQPHALKERGLSHFDSWAAAFGTTKTETEPTPEGTYQEVTRFAKFVNMPELYKMVASNMDIVTSEELAQYVTRPELEGGKRNVHIAPRTPWLDEFQEELRGRVEAIKRRKGPPKKGDDILLSIINDGRKGAIDPRLIVPAGDNFGLAFAPESKLNLLVDNVHRVWEETKNQPFFDPSTGYQKEVMRGPATQMVFSNLGINGGDGKFSGYDWMRREWVRRGIPADQIAFIRDYTTPVAKQRLLNDVNDGKVRILVGSTQKIGTGINAQRRLIAIHNLDPLWYPSDDEQRNGRGLRQGNFNPTLQIHDYTTLDTYDAQMWGLMAKKAGFIEQFFRGDPNLREMEDIGEASQYEQAAAMTISDPRIMQLTGMKQDLAKLERRQRAHSSQEYSLEYRMREAASEADSNARSAATVESAIARAEDISGDKFRMKVGSRTYTDRKDAAEAIDKAAEAVYPGMQIGESRPLGEIGGFPLSIKAGSVRDFVNEEYVTVKARLPFFLLRFAEGAEIQLGSGTGTGAIASAASHIRDLPSALEMWRSRQADAEKRAASNRAALGKPFTEGEKIEPLRRQVREIEAAIYAPPPAIEPATMGVPGQMTALDETGRMGAPERMRPTAGQFGLAEDRPDFAEPQFFSALTRAVEAIPQPKAPGAQWGNLIRNLKGVKQDEIAWSGIDDWLKDHPGLVTKDELLDQLRANEVRVEEVQYGASAAQSVDVDRLAEHIFEGGRREGYWFNSDDEAGQRIEARELAGSFVRGDTTVAEKVREVVPEDILVPFDRGGPGRYGEYTLPGGKNYRELLLTLPEKPSGFDPSKVEIKRNLRSQTQGETAIWYDGKRVIAYDDAPRLMPGGRYEQKPESYWMDVARNLYEKGDRINKVPQRSDAYRTSHWDEPNVLAHIRMDDRTDAEGRRALHISEIQSDWHQQGRRKGYATGRVYRSDELTNWELKSDNGWWSWHATTPDGEEHGISSRFTNKPLVPTLEETKAKLDEAGGLRQDRAGTVPDAPLKTQWPELAMKRVLRYAAEHGYDRVTWDTGATQADRYDLSKQVDKVSYYPEQRRLTAAKGSSIVIDQADVTPEKLPDIIGKEAADKILNSPTTKVSLGPSSTVHQLEGVDLKVGGDGMRGFYDRILPAFLNKYAKRWGAKAERGEVSTIGDMGIDDDHRGGFQIHVDGGTIDDGFPTREAAETRARELKSSEVRPVHAISITPEMRESVMRGQALWEGERGTGAGSFRDLRDDYAQFRGDADPHESARDWTLRRGDETGFEHLVAHTGEETHVYTGGRPRAVPLSSELRERLSQEGAGAVVHHNHPGGTALSSADVGLLALPGLDTVIAHGGGDTFVARLTSEAKMWAMSNVDQAAGVLESLYREAAGPIVKQRLQALINQRGITQREADRIYADIVNRSLDAAGVLDYVSSRSIQPLKDFWAKALIREAATRARKVADAYGIPSPAEDFNELVNRSTVTVRPEEGMAGLPRPDVGQAAAGRPGREAGAGERGEDAGRGQGLAEERDQEETPEFRRWFSGSKVIDGGGKPLMVYHGYTGDEVSEFRPNTYFAFDKDLAETYAEESGGKVGQFYLSIKNPLMLDTPEKVRLAWERSGGTQGVFRERQAALNGWAQEQGHDGIMVPHSAFEGEDGYREAGGTFGEPQLVAFRPEQIKSATGNRGTFDPTDPHILREDHPEFAEETAGGGRGAPPRPPEPPEPPVPPPPPTPSGAPTREQVTADLSKVVFRDTRTLRERTRDFVNDLRADWSDKFKQGFLDDTTGQAAQEREQNAGKLLPHEFSPTWNLRLTRNVPAMMSVVMGRRRPDGSFAGGALRFNDGVFQIDPEVKPFAEIAKPIFDAKLDDVTAAWLIANRARRLKAEGRENLVSDEFIDRYADIDKAYQRDDGTNPLREFREGWRALSRATLDLAENRGLINAEQRTLWEHEDYVPFYRHREDDGASGPGSSRRGTQHLRSGIRRLKGGEDQLNDVYDNMMQHLTSLVGRSIENHAKRLSVDLSSGTEALTPLSKSEREALETPEGRLRLEDMGLDPDQMSAEAKAAARGLWGMLKNDDPNVISLMIDGKPKFYRVNNPLLLRSLATVGPEAAHGLIYGVFRGAKQILSKSVTLDPGYMARNLMRDTAQTAILTGTGGISTVQGMREALINSPSMLAIMAGGGGGSFFYNVGPGQTRRTLSASQRRSVLDTPVKLLQALEHLGMASENANRIATYNAIKARGGSEAEAIASAQDLLNFSMRGDHVAMRTLIDVVPFFNARVQGLYRLYRGAKETPMAFLMRGSILTAAALALWYANHDDDRYKALEDWDKQTYFHFFLGDGSEWWHHLRLPSPFETSAIFAKIPEMFMDYTDNGRIKQLRDAFLHSLVNQLGMTPVPQLLQPVLDLYANKEHFTGRPIVSDYEEGMLPEKRFGPGTSPAMVAVGQAFGVSPDQAQALVRGYGGTVATYLLAATDALGEATGAMAPRATKRLDQMPIVSSFVREEPALATRWTTEFYDLKTRVDQVHKTINKYKKEGDAASIKRLIEDNKEALEAYPGVEKLGQALGKIRGAMTQINANAALTPDQKREQLDKMIAESNRTAALVQSMLRRYEGLAPQ